MADVFTATAPGSGSADIPVGSLLMVSGDGVASSGSRRHQITATGQVLGPFREPMTFKIVPVTTATWRLFDIQQNAGVPKSVNDAAANHNITADEVGSYIRMTATGAKTVTFRPQATEPLPPNGEWHVRNAGASGDITLTAGDGVTLNVPAGGTLVMEPGMTVTVKRVASNVFDVIGLTTAA